MSEDIEIVRRELNEIYNWMRRPDWDESFTPADLAAWAHHRPTESIHRAKAAMDRIEASK